MTVFGLWFRNLHLFCQASQKEQIQRVGFFWIFNDPWPEDICRIVDSWNHRIFWLGRNPQGSSTPTSDFKQDHPKIRPCASEHCPGTSWALAAWCYDHCPGEPLLVLTTLWWRTLLVTRLCAVPSGPITKSRAQCCPSAPCEELQLPWGLPSAPLLWAE